jgi:hypothetical protein
VWTSIVLTVLPPTLTGSVKGDVDDARAARGKPQPQKIMPAAEAAPARKFRRDVNVVSSSLRSALRPPRQRQSPLRYLFPHLRRRFHHPLGRGS